MKKFKQAFAVVIGVGAVAISSAARADTGTFDSSAIVSSISGAVPTVVAVGGAVLGVVVVAWCIKMVRGFIGR